MKLKSSEKNEEKSASKNDALVSLFYFEYTQKCSNHQFFYSKLKNIFCKCTDKNRKKKKKKKLETTTRMHRRGFDAPKQAHM